MTAATDKDQLSWKNNDLSLRLLNVIIDDPTIKRGLYPPVGSTPASQKGGGKPKTDFQWQVCLELFGNDPKYGKALNQACNLSGKAASVARANWAGKIKNHLKV
jgi:hypothetical protein